MTTPTNQNPQLELFKAAPKQDQQYAKASVKAMLKRMEKELSIGLFWVNDALRNMPRTQATDEDDL